MNDLGSLADVKVDRDRVKAPFLRTVFTVGRTRGKAVSRSVRMRPRRHRRLPGSLTVRAPVTGNGSG